MFPDISDIVRADMPRLAGKLEVNKMLAPYTRFRVGGPAQLFFSPKNADDLSYFMSKLDPAVEITIIGLGSNLLIRDGGIAGVVVRLPRSTFGKLQVFDKCCIRAGAAVLDKTVSERATAAGIDGLGFLTGIPGVIGGALRTNAGAYGSEIGAVCVEAIGFDRQGVRHVFSPDQMGFRYRSSNVPKDVIITEVTLRGKSGDEAVIAAETAKNELKRETDTPFRAKTAGSTFKNPPGATAWLLIEKCGLKGFAVGDAQVSTLHANYLINRGKATAADIESLGEEIRRRVKLETEFELEWEVERLGAAS